jgi:NADP-dependent 3-hydroxy acid dehydrogenase YdfG
MSSFNSSSTKVCVIIGYGLAVGECILAKFAEAGYTVAICARNKQRLQEVAESYTKKGNKVHPYACDLSKPETLAAVFDQIVQELGSVSVVVYNATDPGINMYDANPQRVADGVAITVTSVHVSFNYFLQKWKAEKTAGRYLITGGGFCKDGSWSVPWSLQFPAASKAYYKNFAESADATFKAENIRCCCVTAFGVVFHGDNVTFPDPDPAANNQFREKLGNTYVEMAECEADKFVPEIYVPSEEFSKIYK